MHNIRYCYVICIALINIFILICFIVKSLQNIYIFKLFLFFLQYDQFRPIVILYVHSAMEFMKQNSYYGKLQAVGITLVMATLAGCGYHLRSASQWPDALTSLDFLSNNLPSDVQSSLTQFLKSMHDKMKYRKNY